MRDFIRSIDPERYVTMADDNLPKLKQASESAANDADFLMMNQYFGAWHGPREALDPALDKVNQLFPDKMVIISEFGFPGIFAKTPTEADATRVSILREQLPLLAKRDWIAGAILWCYQDYKSRRYFWPGQEQGYLEHGIVDPVSAAQAVLLRLGGAQRARARRGALDASARTASPRVRVHA